MMHAMSVDDQLAAAAPNRFQPVRAAAATLAGLWLLGIVALIVGNIDWATLVAVAGTATGTLGLAFFTWQLAARTLDAVQASQRLEVVAQAQLAASERGLEAAWEEARASRDAVAQAERARLDALAPVIDLQVAAAAAGFRPTGYTPSSRVLLRSAGVDDELAVIVEAHDYETAQFTLDVRVQLTNFGKTPAFVTFRDLGFALPEAQTTIRVDPGGHEAMDGSVAWTSGAERPGNPKRLRLRADIRGPLTGSILDELTWEADATLLSDYGAGWQLSHSALKQDPYVIARVYGDVHNIVAPIEVRD
jgi:hypothetical protein